MIHRLEHRHGFGRRPKVAGMFVLETDDEALLRSLVREIGFRAYHLIKALPGINGAPVGKDADDLRVFFNY